MYNSGGDVLNRWLSREHKNMRFSRPTAKCCWLLFLRVAWAILRKENGFSPGFVKSLPKFKKVLAPYAGLRCIMLPWKRAEYKWMLTGGRSGDISCQKKDVLCRWPRKARKICYLEHTKLENCPGAPPAVSIIVKERWANYHCQHLHRDRTNLPQSAEICMYQRVEKVFSPRWTSFQNFIKVLKT